MTGLYFIDLIVIRLEYLQVILIIAIEDSSIASSVFCMIYFEYINVHDYLLV